LLDHPFIKAYEKVSSDEMARWISPILFSYLSLEQQREANNAKTQQQENGMDLE